MPLSRIRPLARALFWCALVGASVLAILPQPPRLPTDALGDKINHILAFSVLAALAALAWPSAPRLKVVARLSALGAAIEVVQAIPALHRDCDIRDWVADTLAVVAVTGLAALIARGKRARADLSDTRR